MKTEEEDMSSVGDCFHRSMPPRTANHPDMTLRILFNLIWYDLGSAQETLIQIFHSNGPENLNRRQIVLQQTRTEEFLLVLPRSHV